MFIFVDKLRNLLILKGFKTVWTDGSNIKSYVPHHEVELIAVEADEKIATMQNEIDGLNKITHELRLDIIAQKKVAPKLLAECSAYRKCLIEVHGRDGDINFDNLGILLEKYRSK